MTHKSTPSGVVSLPKKVHCIFIIRNAATQPIKRITCEHLDDIEVEQNDSTLRYYQIKSTTNHTLSKSKIIESVKLFLSIQARKWTDASQQYILLSNAHIRKITKDLLVLYPFNKLGYEIKISYSSF
ncbi:MAG: hypothetical protein WAM14_17630 [Candidatus Nitrosopolaris sp.]